MNFIVKDESSIYYECGFSSDNALFLKLGSEAFLITDARYRVEAEERVVGAKVIINGALYTEANRLIKESNVKKIKYDPKEWNLFAFEMLKKDLKTKFKEVPDFSHIKRVIKSSEELLLLKNAAKLGAKAFDNLTAHWGELHVGIKVEVLHNLFLTSSIHFKRLINQTTPDGFANLYIPGFNSVLISNNGIGFNYTISYRIPLNTTKL